MMGLFVLRVSGDKTRFVPDRYRTSLSSTRRIVRSAAPAAASPRAKAAIRRCLVFIRKISENKDPRFSWGFRTPVKLQKSPWSTKSIYRNQPLFFIKRSVFLLTDLLTVGEIISTGDIKP